MRRRFVVVKYPKRHQHIHAIGGTSQPCKMARGLVTSIVSLLHDLRHTAASLMIATEADIASVSRQLGHANVAITLGIFAHAF